MVTSPGLGHGTPQPPPSRAPLAVLTALAAAALIVGTRGIYGLTLFEANCSDEPGADKPCLSSDDPAFRTHPIQATTAAAVLWAVLVALPARHVTARRFLAVLVVLGPALSLLDACNTAHGYGLVP